MANVILFDFDSTLVNTRSVREIRESVEYDLLTPETMAQVAPYQPVPELIRALKERGVLLGIVSNAGRGYIDRILAHLGMRNDFDVVVTYSDVKRAGKEPKPAPDGILLALEQLGEESGPHVLYVGDEYIDIVAAYNAGVTPIVPTWASRETVSTAPAAALSSRDLIDYFDDPSDFRLFAERAAEHQSINFHRGATFFLPLDLSGNVITVGEQLRILCLGRYYSQKAVATASLHEAHALSQDIVRKESIPQFELQPYWVDVVLHVLRRAPEYLFHNEHPFDLITVVPGKAGGHPRLENFLRRVQQAAGPEFAGVSFDASLLRYVDDALKQKTLSADQRAAEAKRALQLAGVAAERIRGRHVLVIDDVVTTGSTIARSIDLLEKAGAASVTGLAFAKTVSVQQDDKNCPRCTRPMRLRRNQADGSHFWGCSGYFADEEDERCPYTEDMHPKFCGVCNRPMVRRTNRQNGNRFWGCTGYNQTPSCNYTEDIQ
ncbi:HAD-IA family hydrolase [Cupriavidus numazuensis]|uniref:phosphoglycolate phosphatase n=1 Tax=Cupriavidus numazuensis TaxID=221992 RepID=A0ABM8TST9_9BURK|nr:HAD-IA family hydrolase [Cupriavidus numazuensis]CAG2159437.1 Pyrophosphatase PpaX [Cupriavidus numazuensis]